MPLYIAKSGDLDRCYRCLTDSLTHWQTLKDRATQLLIKYESGALVKQFKTYFSNKNWYLGCCCRHVNHLLVRLLLVLSWKYVHLRHLSLPVFVWFFICRCLYLCLSFLSLFVLEVCASTQYARLDFVSVCPCLCLFLWLFVFVLEEYAPLPAVIVCVTFFVFLYFGSICACTVHKLSFWYLLLFVLE